VVIAVTRPKSRNRALHAFKSMPDAYSDSVKVQTRTLAYSRLHQLPIGAIVMTKEGPEREIPECQVTFVTGMPVHE
jgi:hypothetical protein